MDNHEIQNNYDNYKKDYSITTLYLLGYSIEQIKKSYDGYDELLKKLSEDKFARTTHKLCTVRLEILKNFRLIADKKSKDFTPIDRMEEYITIDYIRDLREEESIELVRPNCGLHLTIAYINDYIKSTVEKLSHLYPTWINFNYIKDLFQMPNCYIGSNKKNTNKDTFFQKVKENVSRMRKFIGEHKDIYAFNLYYNVPTEKAISYNNLFYNDEKFLSILYSFHNDEFKNKDAVIDARKEHKANIYDFIDDSENLVVVVDCENVSPSRFVSVFLNLDLNRIQKIKKIALYNDSNTSVAWKYIQHQTNIPVETFDCGRVLENKSIVDQTLIVQVMKMHYEDKIDSFILASSDSDFIPLVNGANRANFLILMESDKCSFSSVKYYDENNVKHCYMDDFLQSTGKKFEDKVLLYIFEEMIKEFNETKTIFSLDVDEILDKIFSDTFFSKIREDNERRRESFYNNYLKKGLLLNIQKVENRKRFVLEIKK